MSWHSFLKGLPVYALEQGLHCWLWLNYRGSLTPSEPWKTDVKMICRAGEMVKKLRAMAAFLEHLGLNLSTHMVANNQLKLQPQGTGCDFYSVEGL